MIFRSSYVPTALTVVYCCGVLYCTTLSCQRKSYSNPFIRYSSFFTLIYNSNSHKNQHHTNSNKHIHTHAHTHLRTASGRKFLTGTTRSHLTTGPSTSNNKTSALTPLKHSSMKSKRCLSRSDTQHRILPRLDCLFQFLLNG